MSTPRRAQLPARDPPRPRGTQGPGGDLCEGLPSPLQSHRTKSAELEPTPWPLGPLGTTGWRRAEELVAPNLPGWGWQPTGRRGGHGSAETLRGLTLLHSGTGVKEGVMEKLICRRGMGPGSGGVRPGPTVPGALSPLPHSSNGGRQSPSWCPQRGPGPDPATLPTVLPAVLPIAKPGIYLRCWEGSCGPREKPLTAATGPLGVGCAGRGGRGASPRALTPQACRARWRASQGVLTEVHAVSVVALKQRQEQLSQRGRGLPGDAGGTGHDVDRAACPGAGGRGVCVWREGHSRGDQRLVLLIEEAEVLGAAGLEVRARGPGVSVPAALSH